MNQTERMLKIGEHLHIAEQHLHRLAENLRSARAELDGIMATEESPHRTILNTDRALNEIGTFAFSLEQAFEKPVIYSILKTYRYDGESPVMSETQIDADVR